jgi:hypothetical protein
MLRGRIIKRVTIVKSKMNIRGSNDNHSVVTETAPISHKMTNMRKRSLYREHRSDQT